jgi:putative ABC transport system substrate-binding protein
VRRRAFFAFLGGAAATWPLAVRAQQPVQQSGIHLVGFLSGTTREGFEPNAAALRKGLKEVGFAEGHNLAIEYRFADDHYDRLSALAADLIEHRVALIAADPRGVYAAQKVTKTVPIVFMSGADPVKNGLVASLNRPGGNLTGVTVLASDLNAKRFGLFHDLVPQAAVIGVLSDATNPRGEFAVQEVRAAAHGIGVAVQVVPAGTQSELEAAFATFAGAGVGAVFVINGFYLFSVSDRVNELANRYRMPLTGENRKYVDSGALMSYGPDLADAYRQTGVYAGRILNGEKPADLPVMQPAKFELLINLKTAKTLGLTIPEHVLLLADEVIE